MCRIILTPNWTPLDLNPKEMFSHQNLHQITSHLTLNFFPNLPPRFYANKPEIGSNEIQRGNQVRSGDDFSQLEALLREERERLSLAVINRLIENMPSRVQLAIKLSCEIAKYWINIHITRTMALVKAKWLQRANKQQRKIQIFCKRRQENRLKLINLKLI